LTSGTAGGGGRSPIAHEDKDNSMPGIRQDIGHDEVVAAVVEATLGEALERTVVELFSRVSLDDLEHAVVELQVIGPRLVSALGESARIDARTFDDAKSAASRRLTYHLDRAARFAVGEH
jgi:hypothetical protein